MTRDAIFDGHSFIALTKELEKQKTKFPHLTENKFLLQAVLGEECGEVARALIDNEGDERLKTELLQVAAYAFRWYCNIGEETRS